MTELMQKRLDYHVPAREGKAFRVSEGELVKIIDLRGGQAVDLFAFNVENVKEYLSAEHTRPSISRLFPKEGEAFYTQERRAILTLVEDHNPRNSRLIIRVVQSQPVPGAGGGGVARQL